MPSALLPSARLNELSRRPFRGRMLRDIEMRQPAPAVAQQKGQANSDRCAEARDSGLDVLSLETEALHTERGFDKKPPEPYPQRATMAGQRPKKSADNVIHK